MTPSIDPQLIEDNLTVLRQGRDLLERLDGAAYTRNAPTIALSGVGPHLRHVLDFYARFLGAFGVDATEPARVDYDARDRDPQLETDPVYAAAVIDRTVAGLEEIGGRVAADAPVDVRSDGSPWIPSTVGRELQSLVSHTVHHFALIAIAVRAQGGDPGLEFGVAPSTLRHWSEQRHGSQQSHGSQQTARAAGPGVRTTDETCAR